MSTKDNSSPVLMFGYNTWMILLFGLMSSFQKCAAYDVSTSCPPNITDNTNVILSCFVNKTYINAVPCVTTPSVSFNFASNSTTSTSLCSSPYPSGSCGALPTGSFPCGCTNETGDWYTFQYNFTAIKAVHQNGSIKCAVLRCSRLNITYLHEATCSGLFRPTDTTTPPITTGPTTSKSECPEGCIAAIVIVFILFITIVILVLIIVKCKKEKKRGRRFNCCFYDIRKEEACHSGFYLDDVSASHNIYKFHCCSYDIRKKGACPCGFYPDDVSASHNIYKLYCCPHEKQKKGSCSCGFYPGDESSSSNEETPTPPPGGNNYNRTEVPTINTKAEVGNNWTELTTTTAPGGNNRTELNIQDAKEMQDRNKHLGTDNSPEKEKRRKKKKKKKTFQEVDGEPVSREEKSTINDHKAAQNDNSVYVNESSHAIDNGGHRSLPMPKLSHLTSVERNSTIFQSETPRKLPPLQLKQ